MANSTLGRKTSHYAALGGAEGLRVILRDFYDRLYADLMIGFFFQPHDKERLIESQAQFVGRALGGPEEYTGATIPKVHAKHPILIGHFDRRHQLLVETLADHEVPVETTTAWLELDLKLRQAVVTGAPSTQTLSSEDESLTQRG